MEQDRICSSCGVEVSEDLSNCPLCGKHINNKKKCEINKNSYPIYNMKNIEQLKWYDIIKGFFWIIAIISVVVNIMFKTQPYWFPYVLTALVMIFNAFISPIKENVSSYIKSLIVMSILVAIFLIFIDSYNYLTLNTLFGWALGYAAPLVMSVSVIASSVICFCSKRFEKDLLKNISFIAVLSVVYFVVKITCFKNIVTWPSLVFMCVSIGVVIMLEIFKRNKLVKELIKEFHL